MEAIYACALPSTGAVGTCTFTSDDAPAMREHRWEIHHSDSLLTRDYWPEFTDIQFGRLEFLRWAWISGVRFALESRTSTPLPSRETMA